VSETCTLPETDAREALLESLRSAPETPAKIWLLSMLTHGERQTEKAKKQAATTTNYPPPTIRPPPRADGTQAPICTTIGTCAIL
jgi:hypothetical protein